MATAKFSFLINWGARAGWSENWYKAVGAVANNTEIQANVLLYARRRIACLSRFATIIACRVTDVAIPKKSVIVTVDLMGTLGRPGDLESPDADVPNIAQQIIFSTNGEENRIFLQRGLDDRDVVQGKVTYAQNGIAASNRFWTLLQDDGWQMRDMQKSLRREVLGVDGTSGVLTAAAALGYAENDIVVVNSHHIGNGKRIRWQGKIINVAGATGKLKNYKFGSLSGGEVFKLTPFYADLMEFQTPSPNWAKTRHTGRPFFLSRGRQAVPR
jgi:hypothetical protein